MLAVSQAEQEQLQIMGVPAAAICMIPNPVDLDEFDCLPAYGRFGERWALGTAPLVLFLGKLSPRKRVDVLIRAFARLHHPEAHLVIAGNDMGSGAEAKVLARSLGLRSRTHFTGLLKGEDRIEALLDADLLVYASQHEIFGLVPLEALLAGTPVIVADDSGCAQVIQATGGGQVVPVGDDVALAEAMGRMLAEPAEWRSAAARAALRVRAAYGEDVVCARLEELYRGILSGEKAR